MLMRDVLTHSCRTMTGDQRDRFVEEGCAVVEGLIGEARLVKLRGAMAEMIEASRRVAADDAAYVLEEGHSATEPRLRRLNNPISHHPAFWEFASDSPSADLAADVCGPDVKFYHSKLNFKWPGGGMRFEWHQDIPGWPHTDYSPVTIGLCLEDCGPEQGPLMAIRRSHEGKLHSMYDRNHDWVLKIPDEDLPEGWREDMVDLTGPAGSLVVLNCRVIHGSRHNVSRHMRPLLLNVYSSADSFPYVANPLPSEYEGRIVRGQPPRFASVDPRGMEMPPDWSGGYTPPWTAQGKATSAEAM